MTLTDFRAAIVRHVGLAIHDVLELESPAPLVYIRGRSAAGGAALYEIDVPGILAADWQDLEQVLTGRRPARVMTHVARIVGYYSFVHSWNGSKVAELRDRRRGNYDVQDLRTERGAA